MGVACQSERKTKYSGLFNYNKEKEKSYINSIGTIDFKELFLENLSPEFLQLFKENINSFYSQPFIEGICYEYGLFEKTKDAKKAFNIYKEGADLKYDYLCMYRLHRIYLIDYRDFGLRKNEDLHRLYLYKCFAYLPFLIMRKNYYLLNKININYELITILEKYEHKRYTIFDRFMEFLDNNKIQFNVSTNDIKLMKGVFKSYFSSQLIEKNIDELNVLLDFQEIDNSYYEALLKYCNFYLKYSGDKCDKGKIKLIFDVLIDAKYYKACCDYGRFLMEEKKIKQALNVFKLGSDNGQQFCFCEYFYLSLWANDFKNILSDYNMISYILKNMCLFIAFDQLGTNSFFYTMNYLIKHSSFKQQIQNEFKKYAIEVFKIKERYLQIEKNEIPDNNLGQRFIIEIPNNFGIMYYYGIPDILKSNKEKAMFFLLKSYLLAKEKNYGYFKRFNYAYIYRCRKYLFKINKISLRKFNKTKEKLFRFYEESKLDELNTFELYNYYKLYKVIVNENTQNKLIEILKKGITGNHGYHFRNIVYKEKCKVALGKESSNDSSLIFNSRIIQDEEITENDIVLKFKTSNGQRYAIRVPKNIQFIVAILKLYSKYPNLETEKMPTYSYNGSKIYLYDSIQDNGLEDGNEIIIKDNE